MLAIISPAKTLDYESKLATRKHSLPEFTRESATLIKHLRELEPRSISKLMGISDKLGELNFDRYQSWKPEFDAKDARPACLAFKGDVYLGLQAETFSERDFTWAQKHVRILSGLHGLLRPLDRIRPYRLEMGTKLQTQRGNDLYDFWGPRLTKALNQAIADQNDNTLINLASQEYFGALEPNKIDARIINVHFRDWKNGQYKFLSFFAKKARGLMTRYIVLNRVKTLKALKNFDLDGYRHNSELSNGDDWVFTRTP